MREYQQLVDYRSQVAAMYLAEPLDGEAGWKAFRERRDRLLLEHPQSALSPADRARISQLPFFSYEPRLRVVTNLEPAGGRETLRIDTGGEDGVLQYRRVGRMATPVGSLTLFWLLGYGGGLFLPFRDATSGTQTYAGGRYLTDTIKGTFGRGLSFQDSRVVVDFNYAYNPSCAYSPRFACPLSPAENHLQAPVPAGELAFPRTP
jgi:uncharacterized protein